MVTKKEEEGCNFIYHQIKRYCYFLFGQCRTKKHYYLYINCKRQQICLQTEVQIFTDRVFSSISEQHFAEIVYFIFQTPLFWAEMIAKWRVCSVERNCLSLLTPTLRLRIEFLRCRYAILCKSRSPPLRCGAGYASKLLHCRSEIQSFDCAWGVNRSRQFTPRHAFFFRNRAHFPLWNSTVEFHCGIHSIVEWSGCLDTARFFSGWQNGTW